MYHYGTVFSKKEANDIKSACESRGIMVSVKKERRVFGRGPMYDIHTSIPLNKALTKIRKRTTRRNWDWAEKKYRGESSFNLPEMFGMTNGQFLVVGAVITGAIILYAMTRKPATVGSLTVMVTDPGGTPVQGASASFGSSQGGGFSNAGTTDVTGLVTFNNIPLNITGTLSVVKTGYQLFQDTTVLIDGAITRTVELLPVA